MLNKMKIALAGTIAAASMISGVAHADTETATAEAEILTPVVLSSVADLDFGLIAVGANAGTVSLSTASDVRSCVGTDVICVGTASRGSFNVAVAADGQVIDVSVPTTGVALTGPGTAMPVSLALSTSSITFDALNLETVFIGGDLSVGANQAAGLYSTTFDVTADYQ